MSSSTPVQSLGADVEKIVDFARRNLQDVPIPPARRLSPAFVLLEAVLSMNRNFDAMVVPRLKRLKKHLPPRASLSDLRAAIAEHGAEGFCELWDYRDPVRVQLLLEGVEFFENYRDDNGLQDDARAMRHWARSKGQPIRLPIKGIGLATSQYIRMLVGVDTVKPDRQVLKCLTEITGKPVSPRSAIELIEAAARVMKVRAVDLDYRIWRRYSDASKPKHKCSAAGV